MSAYLVYSSIDVTFLDVPAVISVTYDLLVKTLALNARFVDQKWYPYILSFVITLDNRACREYIRRQKNFFGVKRYSDRIDKFERKKNVEKKAMETVCRCCSASSP